MQDINGGFAISQTEFLATFYPRLYENEKELNRDGVTSLVPPDPPMDTLPTVNCGFVEL